MRHFIYNSFIRISEYYHALFFRHTFEDNPRGLIGPARRLPERPVLFQIEVATFPGQTVVK